MKFSILFIISLLFQNSLFILPAHANNEEFQTLPLYKISTTKNYQNGEVIITYKEKTTKEFQSFVKKPLSDEEKEKAITEKKEKITQYLKESSEIDDLQITDHITDLGVSLVRSEKRSTDELIKKLKENDQVESVEPNYIKTPAYTPNDSYFYAQWAHYRSDDHDIDTTDAWDHESSSASNVTVAVIDSGVDHDFADLSANMWDGSGTCYSDTGTTISCPYHGWDYEDNDNNPDDTTSTIDGYQGHGTHAASIIGATTNNSAGMAGISRYNHVKIMALRFGLDTYSEIKAINFAKNNGAKVINASFAGEYYSTAEKNAIDAFPGILVTAAGNGGDDEIGDNNDTTPLYPCNYSSSNIICVGATNDTDTLTSFSNYGENVDIAAPGESILGIQQGSYWYGSGTSFSSPLVAGTAALLYAERSCATRTDVRDILLENADNLPSLSGKIANSRRLNVNNSLQKIKLKNATDGACATPVYRFWSDQKQGHFYTISEEEKNIVINNYDDYVWKYEGIGFNAYTQQLSNTNPIYRFWSDQNQHHFYTASAKERDQVINDYDDYVWKYEGIAYYAFTSAQINSTPLYRFWSDQKQGHFYTSSEAEKNSIIANYPDNIWRYEGIAWHIPLN